MTIKPLKNVMNIYLNSVELRIHFLEIICFFADEVGFNLSMKLKFGMSAIGMTPITTVECLDPKNFCSCTLIWRFLVYLKLLIYNPYNTAEFIVFLRELFAKYYIKISPLQFILYNVIFYKVITKINLILESCNIYYISFHIRNN